jgi:hypothetical protein
MALQPEGIVDCMDVLYPEFDVVFLFDQSQGHSRKREGSLDANSMNQNYGGAQPILRLTQIKPGSALTFGMKRRRFSSWVALLVWRLIVHRSFMRN